jgi:hypothetical protein
MVSNKASTVPCSCCNGHTGSQAGTMDVDTCPLVLTLQHHSNTLLTLAYSNIKSICMLSVSFNHTCSFLLQNIINLSVTCHQSFLAWYTSFHVWFCYWKNLGFSVSPQTLPLVIYLVMTTPLYLLKIPNCYNYYWCSLWAPLRILSRWYIGSISCYHTFTTWHLHSTQSSDILSALPS